jgi:hypothetical protein
MPINISIKLLFSSFILENSYEGLNVLMVSV